MSNEINKIEVKRINNDTNGNPRHVVHFLSLLTAEERENEFSTLYAVALRKAKKAHGAKFHNKQYGGGIVFQSVDEADCRRKVAKCL